MEATEGKVRKRNGCVVQIFAIKIMLEEYLEKDEEL